MGWLVFAGLRVGLGSVLSGSCTPMLCKRLEAGPASPAWELYDSNIFETRFRSTSTGVIPESPAAESSSSELLLVVCARDSLFMEERKSWDNMSIGCGSYNAKLTNNGKLNSKLLFLIESKNEV